MLPVNRQQDNLGQVAQVQNISRVRGMGLKTYDAFTNYRPEK